MSYIVRFLTILFLIAILFSKQTVFEKNKIFSFFEKNKFSENYPNALKIEIETLKAKIEDLQSSKKDFKENNWEYVPAKIYSSYPFNNKNIISINLGSNDSISNYSAVASAPGVIFGQVIETYPNISLIRTILDNDFQAAVKIGDKKINALLKGGSTPTLEMIEKNSLISSGDDVFCTDTNFPFGFKIGEVQSVVDTKETEPFKKALMRINYNPLDLEEVLIIKNFYPLKADK